MTVTTRTGRATTTAPGGPPIRGAVRPRGRLRGGAQLSGLPWDIGQAQPAVVELASLGRLYGHVLDAGCGFGENAVHLVRSGCRVTAVDTARETLEEARRRACGLPVDFVPADATDLGQF